MRVQSLAFSIVVFMATGLPAQTAIRTRPSMQVWNCPGNVVTNGGFNSNTVLVGNGSMPSSTTDAWTAAYGSPQLQGGAGCHDPDYVSFWGNQVVGEAIQQPVVFQAGHTYNISFCARYHPDPGKPIPNVQIELRGSTGPLTGTGCGGNCEPIMTTPVITSQTWNTYTACWTAPRDLSWLTISPTNGSAVNDGSQVSFGQIDNVCIREMQPPVIEGPADTCTSPATYCVNPPATGPFNWSITNGTYHLANADGSCALVTWNSPNISGGVNVTSTVQGCEFSSELKIRRCKQEPCCSDVLIASLERAEVTGSTATVSVNLSGPPATTLTATVLGAHIWQSPGCPGGPIAVTAASAQPPAPTNWTGPIVPFVNGNQMVWQASSPTGLGQFNLNLQLPPSGSPTCNDKITVCIEFTATFPAANGLPCRTCKIVRCFTFVE
jgi:hypothetical protein